jgi:hypothetical protein
VYVEGALLSEKFLPQQMMAPYSLEKREEVSPLLSNESKLFFYKR